MTDKACYTNINPILECCAPLFSLLLPMKNAAVAEKVQSDLRDQVIELFDVLERMGYEKGLTSSEIQHARYAMAAFTDELIMGSSWPGRLQRMSKPLQLEFFGENSAGQGFFERLEKLRQSGDKHRHLLELFYLCLQMGFEGIYRLKGLEQLMALQVDLRSQLEDSIGKVDRTLSPQAKPKEGFIMKVGRNVPVWAIGSVTGAVMMFLYFGFSWAVNKDANESSDNIEKQAIVLQVLEAEQESTRR
jgi:type VI secretion system protein ImpK